MTNPTRTMTPILAVALLAAGSGAQDRPLKVDPALRARFGFHGPHIKKLDYGLGYLRIAVLDGAPRILVNNRRRGRIDMLRLDGEELKRTSESNGGDVDGLTTGDFDGNGVQDLALLSDRGRLEIRLRGKGAAKVPEIEVGRGTGLLAGDLDGDGRTDLVVQTRRGIRTVTRIVGKPVLSPIDPTVPKLRSMRLFDADGDGRLDLVTASSNSIRLRLGRQGGGFGPWLVERVHSLHTLFEGAGHGGKPTLATIEGTQDRLVEYRIQRSNGGERPTMELYPLTLGRRRGGLPMVHGDLDGDGDLDLVVADRSRAELLYFFEEKGTFRRETAPCLAGVNAMSLGDVDGDGTLDLVLCSTEEKVLAWKSGACKRGAFPTTIPVDDIPVAAAVVDGRLLVITRTERRKASLWHLPLDGKGKRALLCTMGRLGSDPTRLGVAQLDGQFGPELYFVVPGTGLRILTSVGQGKYAASKDEMPGAGFTKRMEEGALAQVGPDTSPSLFVVREKYARTFRLAKDEAHPVIAHQDQGPDGIEGMRFAAILADGRRFYLDKKSARVYRSGKGGPTRTLEVPDIGAKYMLPHGDQVLLVGENGVLRIDPAGRGMTLARVRVMEPPTPKTDYYRGLAADLDGDGDKELVVADSHIHGLHVFKARGDKLELALVFPIFETPSERGFKYEPYSFVAGDINGDGLVDLAMLCRDRVLVYPQEK